MRRHAWETLVAIVALELGLVGAGSAYYVLSHPGGPNGPEVVASFYPYQFFTSRIAGNRFAVAALVPPGVEPHDWEPRPRDVLTIGTAAAFVYNGYAEAYLRNLLGDLPDDRPLRVNASAGIRVLLGGEGGARAIDPHLWLDPVRVGSSVDTIAEALGRADPAAAPVFRANAEMLRQDLAQTDQRFATGLQTCARRAFITQHESFAYLAERYNLTQYAIQGLSPDQEPTPAKMQEILGLINATGSKVIFFEEFVNPAVAQTLADEAHVQTMVLSPVEGLTPEERANGEDYFTLMEMNLQNLRTALGCT